MLNIFPYCKSASEIINRKQAEETNHLLNDKPLIYLVNKSLSLNSEDNICHSLDSAYCIAIQKRIDSIVNPVNKHNMPVYAEDLQGIILRNREYQKQKHFQAEAEQLIQNSKRQNYL